MKHKIPIIVTTSNQALSNPVSVTIMGTYKENPKTKGSGIVCAIPQKGICPNKCDDCFFQSGRSYFEPLDKNLPNMPTRDDARNRIVRVNDGNDSNVDRETVIAATKDFKHKFYNTSIPENLEAFDAPVVLTINPGKMTDIGFYRFHTDNLMFVRLRANTWNKKLQQQAIQYYAEQQTPIVLTFMAYFEIAHKIPQDHRINYVFRKRTLNHYWAITTRAWREIMHTYEDTPYEKWVYSCGKLEGEAGTSACRHCGNCLREYYATLERMRKGA